MTIIRSATTNDGAFVGTDGRLWGRNIQETVSQEATELGEAYNLNTKKIALTTTTASAILYYKHDEEKDLNLATLVFFIGSGGTMNADWEFTVIKNPTAGTIISNALPITISENRNFSSKPSLPSSLQYQGVEGDTFTDGDDYIFVMGAGAGRTALSIDTVLKKGDSLGITLDTNTSAGSTNVYVAMIAHLHEE